MLKPFTAEALLLRLEPTTTAAAAPKSLAILSHSLDTFGSWIFHLVLLKKLSKVRLSFM
ncbi:hypothetical protein HanRHA438_Chr04g0161151 [Helianthus annuus]|nr:hypothetical protein HanHA300_Chr04g0124401 [Helianthus annuus]KAJ0595930.1 hypothetical protein HanHA89_Chr04g0136941 [Helianthus annuus]KAJ0925569.1 hypothetical protein HanRHA438_Chr04g0161151 [Helianthus annuus]